MSPAGRAVFAFDLLDLVGDRKALSGSRLSASPCIAPVITLSMFDLLDVVTGDQIDHVVEDAEVLVGVLARGDLAQEAADNRERDDRCRDPEDDAADV